MGGKSSTVAVNRAGDTSNWRGCFSAAYDNVGRFGSGSYHGTVNLYFSAAKGEVHNGAYSNIVYGKSDTVQPPAIPIYAWRRKS